MTLGIQQKLTLRAILDNPQFQETLAEVCKIERAGWLDRLKEAALTAGRQPLELVELATRADDWDKILNVLRRHAREEAPKEQR